MLNAIPHTRRRKKTTSSRRRAFFLDKSLLIYLIFINALLSYEKKGHDLILFFFKKTEKILTFFSPQNGRAYRVRIFIRFERRKWDEKEHLKKKQKEQPQFCVIVINFT